MFSCKNKGPHYRLNAPFGFFQKTVVKFRYKVTASGILYVIARAASKCGSRLYRAAKYGKFSIDMTSFFWKGRYSSRDAISDIGVLRRLEAGIGNSI